MCSRRFSDIFIIIMIGEWAAGRGLVVVVRRVGVGMIVM
jgi:hypothetical protein